MSNLEVKMIDIHEWDAEESMDKRRDEKEKIRKELEKSVKAIKGNVGMIKRMLKTGVTTPKKYKCSASFVWYSVKQDNPQQGEVAYINQTGWENRGANWAPLLETAKEKVKRLKMEKLVD